MPIKQAPHHVLNNALDANADLVDSSDLPHAAL